MPNDFTRTLINYARYWPKLYHCRADLLNSLFCSGGSGQWQDGRIGTPQSQAKWLEDFQRMQRQLRRMHQNQRPYYRERAATLEILAETASEEDSLKDRALLEVYRKLAAKPFRPDRLRTDAQVESILRDRRHRRIVRSAGQRHWIRLQTGRTAQQAWESYSGRTVFGNFEWSNLAKVPDDVRPCWLAGVRECLDMIIQWDLPEQVEKARAIQADLVRRFGPIDQWHRRKRIPPPPLSVREPRDVVGRSVRVALPGERSWGEHRPDLGPNHYRSLNDTLSSVPSQLVPESQKRKIPMQWGHIFTGVERHYGVVVPKLIVGLDLTPTAEEPVP